MRQAGGMDVRRIHATVSGRVQGVGFRYSACTEALRLGLVGWVRNLDDGRVELEAEGAPDAVGALADWLAHGPAGARVEGVEAVDIAVVGDRGFRIV